LRLQYLICLEFASTLENNPNKQAEVIARKREITALLKQAEANLKTPATPTTPPAPAVADAPPQGPPEPLSTPKQTAKPDEGAEKLHRKAELIKRLEETADSAAADELERDHGYKSVDYVYPRFNVQALVAPEGDENKRIYILAKDSSRHSELAPAFFSQRGITLPDVEPKREFKFIQPVIIPWNPDFLKYFTDPGFIKTMLAPISRGAIEYTDSPNNS
jgi:hypothetical protein